MEKKWVPSQIEGAKKWYETVAEDFQNRYSGVEGIYFSEFEDNLYDRLANFIGKTFLDLGTGGGRLALRVAPKVKEAIGVDISKNMIEIANSKKGNLSNVSFEVADATQMRFPDGYFDLIVSAGMFEYLSDPAPFLKEAARVLKDDGELIFTCHQRNPFPRLNYFQQKMARKVLPHHFASSASFCVANLNMRETLFQKAYHRWKDMRAALLHAGFSDLRYRTTFLSLPTHLFFWGSESGRKSIQEAAVQLNLFLGWCPATKWMGDVLVVKAKKKRNA